MESICKRFPVAGMLVLENLDNQSLTRNKEASRGMAYFLEYEKRFYFIRQIKRYHKNFEGFEESWNQVVKKIPVDVIKQLASAVKKSCQIDIYMRNSPHDIASYEGQLDLLRFIIEKVKNKNPAHKTGWTPLHTAACNGNLNKYKLIMEKVKNKLNDS